MYKILFTSLIFVALVLLNACNKPITFNGVDITDSSAFTAQVKAKNINGEDFNLQAQAKEMQNKADATLITFGFTQCPDYCPTTLAKIMQVQNILINKKKLRVIFITIDNKNDTPYILKNYLAAFNPKFVGISPNDKELEIIKNNFKISSFKENNTFNHTTGVYVLDKKMKLRLYLPYNLDAGQMAQDISNL